MSALPEPEMGSKETIAESQPHHAYDEEGRRWAENQALALGADPATLKPSAVQHTS